MELSWPEYLVALGGIIRLQPDFDPELLRPEWRSVEKESDQSRDIHHIYIYTYNIYVIYTTYVKPDPMSVEGFRINSFVDALWSC